MWLQSPNTNVSEFCLILPVPQVAEKKSSTVTWNIWLRGRSHKIHVNKIIDKTMSTTTTNRIHVSIHFKMRVFSLCLVLSLCNVLMIINGDRAEPGNCAWLMWCSCHAPVPKALRLVDVVFLSCSCAKGTVCALLTWCSCHAPYVPCWCYAPYIFW